MGSFEDEGLLKIFIKQGCKNKVINIIDKHNPNKYAPLSPKNIFPDGKLKINIPKKINIR